MTAYKILIPLKQSQTVLSFDFTDYINAEKAEAIIESAINPEGSASIEDWLVMKDDAGRRCRLWVDEIAGYVVMDVAKVTQAAINEQKASQKQQAHAAGLSSSIALPQSGLVRQ